MIQLCVNKDDIRSKIKLSCERCATIFYVLGDSFECPKCGNMVDQYYKLNKYNNKDSSGHYQEDEPEDTSSDDDHDADHD